MLDQILQDPMGTLKAILELGWPAIVLVMVAVLWLRINSERDKNAAALNGHVVALEAALDRCHDTIKATIDNHDKVASQAWGEAITQAANASAIARQNRDDILYIRNWLDKGQG